MAKKRPSPGRFDGWPAECFEFWEGLGADNTRSYWQAHAEVFETAIKEPTAALAEALTPLFGGIHVFRPNRDVRFSKDKSPYKLTSSLVGHGSHGSGALYLQLGLDGLMLAGGYYQSDTATLTRFREVISERENADAFDKLRAELGKSGLTLDGNELKTTPRGWDKDHPRMDLLRLRNLALAQTRAPGAWLQTPECFEMIIDTWTRLDRWNEWLHDKVGPPSGGIG